MFILKKTHAKEREAAIVAAVAGYQAVLDSLPLVVFALDAQNRIRAPLSRSLAPLFGGRDPVNRSFERFLESILHPHSASAAKEYLQRLRSGAIEPVAQRESPLHNVAARIARADGTAENRFLTFSFQRAAGGSEADASDLYVTIRDVTEHVDQTREIEELRQYSAIQTACLASIANHGLESFRAFLQSAHASMEAINVALRKPAREEAAFRAKLEEIQAHVVDVKTCAAQIRLTTIQTLAASFEEALLALQGLAKLTGTDFLPLAVRLDQLFAPIALMRSMTQEARVEPPPVIHVAAPRTTESGTQIIAAPTFPPPVGGLESALHAVTEHVAAEAGREVRLECTGLEDVPAEQQARVKNIAIQLIRNAVLHGIERVEDRLSAGKSPQGRVRVNCVRGADDSLVLDFEDDGRGLDIERIRRTACERGLVAAAELEQMPDRQAMKLIFRSAFASHEERPSGMTLVRRLVNESGGRIGFGSVPGRHTRFRVNLPARGAALPEESAIAASRVA